MAYSGLRQREFPSPLDLLGESDQTGGVGFGIGGTGQHHVVAGHLALQREPVLNPPDRGMKEEQRFHYLLSQIGPIIPAAKVRQFVQQNDF